MRQKYINTWNNKFQKQYCALCRSMDVQVITFSRALCIDSFTLHLLRICLTVNAAKESYFIQLNIC